MKRWAILNLEAPLTEDFRIFLILNAVLLCTMTKRYLTHEVKLTDNIRFQCPKNFQMCVPSRFLKALIFCSHQTGEDFSTCQFFNR